MVSQQWKKLPLKDVLTLQRGLDLPSRLRIKGNIPIVTSSGINGQHNHAPVKGPGVVTGRYGTIGEVFYVDEDFWPLNTTLYVSDFKGNDPLYCSFLLTTIDFKSYSGKSGVPGVNRNDLHEINVNLPPTRAEQQAIAKVLSNVDGLIDGLTKLIAKKRDIKTATMQRLLTGKTRLPGFGEGKGYKQTELGEIPEDWKSVTLWQVARNISRGASPRPIQNRKWFDQKSTVGWVRISDVTKSGRYLK